jgi:hypothetical protein
MGRHRIGHRRRGWGAFVALAVLAASLLAGGADVAIGRDAARPVVHDARGPRVPASSALVDLVSGSPFGALSARLRWAGATIASPEDPTPAFELAAPAASGLEVRTRRETAIVPPPPDGFGARHAVPSPAQLPPTSYGDVTPTGGTWALLIGINDYPGMRYDLRSAVSDMQDVEEALKRRGVTADRRMVLRDGQATAGLIRAALDWLSAHAGEDSTIVFFYAGHVQKLGGGTEAIVGADGNVVTDAEVAALLDRSPSRRAWIGIAACYAAGFTEVVKPGRVLTAAAPANSLAFENDAFGRSYLVEYMVRRAMLGAGITTVEAAFAWAVTELQRDHPDRVPVQYDELPGDLDLTVPSSGSGSAPGSGGSSPPPSSPPPSQPDGCANLTAGVVRCNR